MYYAQVQIYATDRPQRVHDAWKYIDKHICTNRVDGKKVQRAEIEHYVDANHAYNVARCFTETSQSFVPNQTI